MNVILTGATGMVGEGVLHECLQSPLVASVLVINRKPCGIVHVKLKEIILPDFFDLSTLQNRLSGFDACFFCLGVSSVGMKEPEYYKLTYNLTLQFAQVVCTQNPGMIFSYISGRSTDSSEKGRMMWARVKGKTENDLMKLPFKKVYAFRPGYLHPTKGLKNVIALYKYLGWLYPALRFIFPSSTSTLRELGLAMINAANFGYEKNIIEVKDIVALANSNFSGT